jgi:hypothetical protein
MSYRHRREPDDDEPGLPGFRAYVRPKPVTREEARRRYEAWKDRENRRQDAPRPPAWQPIRVGCWSCLAASVAALVWWLR